jgi:hypothetical protein
MYVLLGDVKVCDTMREVLGEDTDINFDIDFKTWTYTARLVTPLSLTEIYYAMIELQYKLLAIRRGLSRAHITRHGHTMDMRIHARLGDRMPWSRVRRLPAEDSKDMCWLCESAESVIPLVQQWL